MNKKMLLITLGILALIIGSGVYLSTSGNGKQAKHEMLEETKAKEQTPVSVTPATETPSAPKVTPGAYVDYKEGIVASTAGTKLLFFHAPWCSQCRELEADIKHDGVPSEVTIIKVDYDSNQALRQKYGVTIQTSVVLINDAGEKVKKYVAYDEPTLDSVIKNLL